MRTGVVKATSALAWLLASSVLHAQTIDTLRLGLGDAARLAAQRSAQVLEAAEQVARAEAAVALQRSALLPQLYATVDHSAHTLNTASFGLSFPTPAGEDPLFDPNGQIVGPVALNDARARLRQTVFDYAAYARLRGARAGVTAARAQASAAGERAAGAAANAYVQAARAAAELGARAADVAAAEELVQIARRQLQAGVGVKLDVTRAEAQLATVRAQLVAARNAAERSRLAFTRALGLGPDAVVQLTDSLALAQATLPTEAEATARALAQRADVQALQQQIRAAALQVSAVRAERYPNLNFIGDEGYIGKSWDHMLNTYAWAVQVSVPVFTGFRERARIDEQQAVLRALTVRERDLEAETSYQVRAALLDVTGAQEQLAATQQRLRLAEQELAEARQRYEAGVAGSADVITASLRLTDARTAYVNAEAQYAAARVALAAAQGTVTEIQ